MSGVRRELIIQGCPLASTCAPWQRHHGDDDDRSSTGHENFTRYVFTEYVTSWDSFNSGEKHLRPLERLPNHTCLTCFLHRRMCRHYGGSVSAWVN